MNGTLVIKDKAGQPILTTSVVGYRNKYDTPDRQLYSTVDGRVLELITDFSHFHAVFSINKNTELDFIYDKILESDSTQIVFKESTTKTVAIFVPNVDN